jgi:phage tail sheath protein FI
MSTPYQRPGIFLSETLTPLVNNTNIPGEALGAFAYPYNIGPTVPTLINSWSQFRQLYGNFNVANGSLLTYAVWQFFNNGGASCFVLRIPNVDATTASLVLDDVNSPTDDVATISAISPGGWGNTVYVNITSAGAPGRFNINVYNQGTALNFLVEQFVDMSINPADHRFVGSIVNSKISGSNYINVQISLPGNTYTAGVTDLALVSLTPLAGGADGSTPPDLTVTIPAGLDQLQGQALYINLPGVYDSTIINPLITWAIGRGDTMFVLDGPPPNFPETSADVVNNYLNLVSGGSPLTPTSYAALYTPWVLAIDAASAIAGATIYLPPGGAVMGCWNATDVAVGPWQTPAGITYGKLNIVDLETHFTTTDLDTLNVAQINALKLVPGYNKFCIFGGRTLEPGYPDRYVSVRRELIKLELDFVYLVQFALFAPNDAKLWQAITTVLTNYLTQQMQAGALGGTTPTTSFTVICDSTNNSLQSAQAGIVNCDVAVSLLSPAEFILINISQFQNSGATSVTTNVANVDT